MRHKLQPAVLADAAEALSRARLSNYRRFYGAQTDAEQYGLYRWNETLSMLFFKTLSLTEIAIRNQFHKTLSVRYGATGNNQSNDWYNYLVLSTRSVESIQKITHQKRRRRGPLLPKNPMPSPDDVVSKLTFGFWPHLLDVSQDTFGGSVDWSILLPAVLINHRQRDVTYWRQQRHQDAVFARLDLCNALRNRIAHHEPLWKTGDLLEERRARPGSPPVLSVQPAPTNENEALQRLHLFYDRLLELLGWMSPSLLNLHEVSETHFQLKALMSSRAIKHYRGIGLTETLCIDGYRKLSSLKKRFRQLSKKGVPVIVNQRSISIGHWTTLPY